MLVLPKTPASTYLKKKKIKDQKITSLFTHSLSLHFTSLHFTINFEESYTPYLRYRRLTLKSRTLRTSAIEEHGKKRSIVNFAWEIFLKKFRFNFAREIPLN